jgi:hypothetical protein
VLLDDAERDAEAESGSDADRLGGEERVEDLASNSFVVPVSRMEIRKISGVWLVVMIIFPSPAMASTALAIKFINT